MSPISPAEASNGRGSCPVGNTVQTLADDDTLGNLVAWLASDYAAYVTGAVMGVGLDD